MPKTAREVSEPPPAYVSMRCHALALAPGLLPPGDASLVDDFWHPRHLWVVDVCFPDGTPSPTFPQRLRDWRDAYGRTGWWPAEKARLQAAHVPYYRLTTRLFAYFLRSLKPGPALARVEAAAAGFLTPSQRADSVSLASRLHLPGPARPTWPSGWGVAPCGDPAVWDLPRWNWRAAATPRVPCAPPRRPHPATPRWFNATSARVLAAPFRERGEPLPDWLKVYFPCDDDLSGWCPERR